MNLHHSYSDFEYFCPACNVTFRNFAEYQSHMILKDQQRPYQDEIRETVRFMKEVIETVPHKSVSSETVFSPEVRNRRNTTRTNCKRPSMYFVNFFMVQTPFF